MTKPTPRPTVPGLQTRYRESASFRWGYHLLRVLVVAPWLLCAAILWYIGEAAAIARGDWFVAVLPAAFFIAAFIVGVIVVARRPG